MPVTPLPPSNTARYRLKYNNGIDDHTMQMRVGATHTPSDVNDLWNLFLTAIAPALPLITIVGEDFLELGSDVGIPVATTGLATTYGTGTLSLPESPNEITFSGRGFTGRKIHLGVIGVQLAADSNFIFTPAEQSWITAAVAVLNSGAGAYFVDIAAQPVKWYPRVTFKPNDHFVRRRRSG